MGLNSLVKLSIFLRFDFLARIQHRFQETRRPLAWLFPSIFLVSVRETETERQKVIASLYHLEGINESACL